MEENNVKEVVEELKNAKDDELRAVVEKWLETIRNQGLKIGALYISAAIEGVIQKHLKKGKDASKRDLERCVKEIYKIISVQLKPKETQQNDLEETGEDSNDGTAE